MYIIITAGASFDEKNNSKDKKLLSCFSKDGCAVNFEKHVGTVLRDDLRSLCKKERVDLSGDLAAYLIDICGDDLGILKNECLKMCAFTGQDGKITKEMIDEICTKKADANIYAIANLIIKKDMRKAMREINTLLSQKVAVIQIISNLNISFYGLYCASCARSAGKTADEAACDLKEKFLWRMKNYYRDSNGIDNAKLYAVCRVMCEAENRFKSSACEERVLLEKAVAQCISILI